MRVILFLFCFVGMFLMASCDKSNNSLTLKTSERASALLYALIEKSDYVLLVPGFYQADNKVYMLRGTFVDRGMQSISVKSVSDFGDRLVVNLINGTSKSFSLHAGADFVGHSLVTVSDAANQFAFYSNGLPKADPDVSWISCTCVQQGIPAECANGGIGSSNCSVDSRYQVVGGNQIGSKCSVNCASGYYSCCNK
ncbi:MAG: hypothetical protein WBO44_15135 [Saprospiraceae bacterium]